MSNGDYVLRPEAGPVNPNSLNRSQQKAFKSIVAALAEASRLAGQTVESNRDRGAFQQHRVSRLFFVSGEPGTGKTSLYLTLRTILGEKKRFAELRTEYEKQYEDLRELAGTTRWLEPLDLEVAVDEGENLLAAVLVRIFDAIRDSFDASQKCREAKEDLEALANDIGIAWDGNLKARAGFLDPDSYSQEVMRAQGTRLRANERLRTSLEALFKEQCFGLKDEQLFVLPIDDFYLKPAASLELLRLLRMISVPHLFFLIMGDIKTVEALFFEKALAEWTAVAGSRIFASLRGRRREVLGRVREMKARYLRKLLPPGQQAVIGWTQWDEALAFSPPHADSVEVSRLSSLLSDVRISWKKNEAPITKRNLLNYLAPLGIPEQGDNGTDKGKTKTIRQLHEAYSGLLILDTTPRELSDLWMRLPKRSKEDATKAGTEFDDHHAPPYLRMIVDLALSAIEEQDFLSEKDQEILRFVFPSSDKDDLLIWTDKLSLAQKAGPWTPISSGEAFVRRHFDWELRIAKAKKQSACFKDDVSGRKGALPPRQAAWIILLHDLVWNWNRKYLVDNLVHSLCEGLCTPKATMDRPSPSKPGWAWYKDEDENKNEQWVHFRFPKLHTFRQLDRFLVIWNHLLEKRLPESDDPMKLERATLEKEWEKAAAIAQESDEAFAKFVRGVVRGK